MSTVSAASLSETSLIRSRMKIVLAPRATVTTGRPVVSPELGQLVDAYNATKNTQPDENMPQTTSAPVGASWFRSTRRKSKKKFSAEKVEHARPATREPLAPPP